MLTQQTARKSLQRATLSEVSLLRHPASTSLLLSPTFLLSNGRLSRTRNVSTEKTDFAAAQELLAQQRKRRPVAPHLTIYKPQMSWIGSALNRITGSILSGGFYIFGFTYLIAPLFGWHVGSMSIAAAVGAWPLLAKVAMKFSLAMPFIYHSLNGVRHLVWDTGSFITNKQVIKSGWVVVGLSVLGSAILAYV